MMHDGLQPWFYIHGQQITVTSGGNAGQTFTAALVIRGEQEFNGEVLQDVREKTFAIFENIAFPKLVKPNDEMKDGIGQVWRFAKRVENPTDSTVEWEVIKKV